MDGIDLALLESDGESYIRFIGAQSCAYDKNSRNAIGYAIDALDNYHGGILPDLVRQSEALITRLYGSMIGRFISEHHLTADDIDIIGCHGQTILHRSEERISVQLGDGPLLAQLTGIDVVYDFRAADMAAGGEGAPLAPLFHQTLLNGCDLAYPVAVVNIGGIANITWLGEDKQILAFDTGPGNGLLNDWAQRHVGEALDKDGALAAKGQADMAIVAQLLGHEFFAKAAPKSLDRFDFSLDLVAGLTPEDGAATLAQFSIAALQKSLEHVPAAPATWIVCGGGRHNPVLMGLARTMLPGRLLLAEDVGWRGDDLEAELFAWAGVRHVRGLPLSLPEITGASAPIVAGVLAKP